MVQSNNATYGGTGQIEQQFAITRARAMESRREIAVATTNSVSGFIDAMDRGRSPHAGVHSRQHGGRDAAAERTHAGHPDRALAGPGPGLGGAGLPCAAGCVLRQRSRGARREHAGRAELATRPTRAQDTRSGEIPVSQPTPPETSQNEMEGEAPI